MCASFPRPQDGGAVTEVAGFLPDLRTEEEGMVMSCMSSAEM